MFYAAYGIGMAAILFNVYLIWSYIRCGFGKYPPVISSFGTARHIVLKQAEEFLAGSSLQRRVVDLGCGCGSLLLPLAAQFPQHEFIGLEWDMFAYLLIRFRSRKLKNIRLIYGNFMVYDWSNFDLILCFIGNDIASEVAAKICREGKKDVRVISEAFVLPGLKTEKEIAARTYWMPLKVFVYRPKE